MCLSGQLLPVRHHGVVPGAARTQVHNWSVREHFVVDVGRETCLQSGNRLNLSDQFPRDVMQIYT